MFFLLPPLIEDALSDIFATAIPRYAPIFYEYATCFHDSGKSEACRKRASVRGVTPLNSF